MSLLRLYLPAIVMAVWAVLLFLLPLGHELRAVAMLTIAIAFKLQIDEARRQHRDRRERLER